MTLRLALLGDSIAAGVGATRRADTLAARLLAALSEQGVAAEARVEAVPGARSSDLAAQVRRVQAWRPDVALVLVGANDLGAVVPARRAAAELRETVRELVAGGTEVVLAPAPDLSVVPSVPASYRGLLRAASLALRAEQVRVTLEEGGRVADAEGTASAAFAQDLALFSADRFHPSSAGYAVIARAIAPAVLAAVSGTRSAR